MQPTNPNPNPNPNPNQVDDILHEVRLRLEVGGRQGVGGGGFGCVTDARVLEERRERVRVKAGEEVKKSPSSKRKVAVRVHGDVGLGVGAGGGVS